MRLLMVLAALALAQAMPGEAFAQKSKCPANFQNTCMSTCVARGGQPRLCPQYCAKRIREGCRN